MNNKKKKFSRKLILFVYSISLLLILGSFTYFYFSGKEYIQNAAINNLQMHYKNFENASLNQIKEYSNEIDGSFFNFKIDKDDSKQRISNYLKINKGVVEEFYLFNRRKNEVVLILPVIVFSGELVINYNPVDVTKYNILLESINPIHEFNDVSTFGYINENSTNNYYLKRDFGEFCLITKFNRINIFLSVIEKIYHPPNINFHLANSNNVIEFSTDIFWVNQKIEKYLQGSKIGINYFDNNISNLIYGEWQSDIFKSSLILTNNVSNLQNEFEEIIYKLFLYSLFIYLIIVIATLVYTNRISKSLNKISRVTQSIGKGNFKNKIDLVRNDELGLLIDSFNQMVDNLKESYEQIGLTNKELENKIAELVKTKNELTKKEKLALIGETISKISHEIQNKISGVSVWVQNLELQPNLDQNALMYVGEIKRSLNSFIEMLLNFKKFYRKPFIERSNFSFQEMIERVLKNFQSDIEAKKLEIYKNLSDKEVQIYADKILIEEVIVNLFVNAIYFSPERGKININIKFPEKEIIFSISDEGEGISENEIENIFNPFFTTKSSGSGLGLAISKNIIEAHSGKIQVENLKPRGAKFIIYLPTK